MSIRITASLMLLLLLLMLPFPTLAGGGDYGPRMGSAGITGNGYSLQVDYVAEPLVEGEGSGLLLSYVFKADPRIVSEAYLRSPEPISPRSLSAELRAVEHRLKIPADQGVLNYTLRAPEGSMGEKYNITMLFYLDITFLNGSSVRRVLNMSFNLWVLSPEGSVPRPLVLGVVLSVMLAVAAPVAAYLKYSEKRRAYLASIIILGFLLALLALSLARGMGGTCPSPGKKPYVLKYVWSANGTGFKGAGAIYVWSSEGKLFWAGLPSIPGKSSIIQGCPSPLCVQDNASEISVSGVRFERIGRANYYYHNALRRAVLYDNNGGEAIYDVCGHLFRLMAWKGDSLYYYALNASLGYDPPIAPGFYAKLLLGPPLASIAVSALIAWRVGRGEKHAARGGGR